MTILNWWLDRFPRYEFLVEYFLFLIPMVIHLPRRKHFFLRLLPMLAISFFLSKQWNSTWASILPLYILRYLILFSLGIAVTMLCFDCDLLSALYCGAAAYAAQHTFNRIFDLVILSTGLEKRSLSAFDLRGACLDGVIVHAQDQPKYGQVYGESENPVGQRYDPGLHSGADRALAGE